MQYRKQNVYRQILDSAMDEFDEKGYNEASVRAIAKRADTSVGNLYRYFKNKEELYISCLDPVLSECIDWTEKIFDISSREAICLTAAHISAYVEAHRREFRIISQGPAAQYASFLSGYAACIVRRLSCAADLDHGTVSPCFLDTLANAFVGGMRQIMEDHDDTHEKDRNILAFMIFLFGDFKERLSQN